MVNMLAPSQDAFGRWFRRFKSGDFDTRQEGRQGTWKTAKKFEEVKLQTLLDEYDSQTQKQLADQLGVSQQALFNRLPEMGKIQKNGRWVPRELNDRQMEKRKNTCDILLARYKRKSFLHSTVSGDEKWMYFENPNHKNCG